MPYCAAIGCSTSQVNKNVAPPITLHLFPSDPEEKKTWVQAVGRENWTPSKSSRLCSKHFNEDDIDRSPFYSKLKKGVVPTIFDANPEHLKHKQPKERRTVKRHELTSRNSSSPSNKKIKIMEQSNESALNEVEDELNFKDVSSVATNCSLRTTKEQLEEKIKQYLAASPRSEDTPTTPANSFESSERPTPEARKRPAPQQDSTWAKKRNVPDPVPAHPEDEHECGAENDCTVFGKSVGLELELIRDQEQRDIAKKFISDVLYYAKRGKLTEGSYLGVQPAQNPEPVPIEKLVKIEPSD